LVAALLVVKDTTVAGLAAKLGGPAAASSPLGVLGGGGQVQSVESFNNAIGAVAKPMFQTYLVPFEITSVLLVIAVVGAVVLARRSSETSGETTTAAAGQGTHTAEEAGDGDPGRGESTVPVP
ncbi:MAG: NADH-quinone oxidoreductase subunit J family protein, partial [Acidimicrobiales bacterium]